MTLEIIIALIVGIVAFLVLVAIWYLVFVPSKRKALAAEASASAEKEAEVIKQRKADRYRAGRCLFTVQQRDKDT